ncbi:hypothetical protein PTSG_11182 [Salpingoeca rosetta]|uniref:Queuosine 5'-phosphate N-glycosylase/hydrolase n=1 Tax=Salpingoeca rosetta (strain ATCC 50818 / BSB-021) TaxID=946362 RepID=F2USN5_SALR5|nr:uncharacterized protein PTSG_11182 [Salpingoeca rosetta]EGD81144.1 hypothetical protein PTSG_11182 [Salpingoeca rosetta]|eukprot:XP_004987829.1 hypothetical protein PTSG_11182 [Salpingoeca rosetta]
MTSKQKQTEQPCELAQVLPTCEAVAAQATHVRISQQAIDSTAKKLATVLEENAFSLAHWRMHELHPSDPKDNHVDFIFVLDALNFSFWMPEGEKYAVEYRGKQWTGYWSLVAALSRAIDEGIDMCNPAVYGSLTLDQLRSVFRSVSGTEVPLLEQRHEVLTQAGQCLVKDFGGTFRTCVERANKSAASLVRLVTQHFPSFRDMSIYNGNPVYLLKRVQILVADLWGCYQGAGWGAFRDIDAVTMFADYRCPHCMASRLYDVLVRALIVCSCCAGPYWKNSPLEERLILSSATASSWIFICGTLPRTMPARSHTCPSTTRAPSSTDRTWPCETWVTMTLTSIRCSCERECI